MTLPLSCIVIAKNESKNIYDCLQSLEWVKELIVIDNGSIDDTVKQAEKKASQIYKNFETSFSKLRTFGLEKATQDWVLYIDADERVPKSLAHEIESIIKEKSNKFIGSYWIRRRNIYFEQHSWPFEDKQLRLFKKKSFSHWKGDLHESAEVYGESGTLNTPLIHYTHNNLHYMVEKTNSWSEIEASLRLSVSHPSVVFWRMMRVMLTGFYESYIRQKGYTVGIIGIIESMYQSFSYFITYAKLWERQKSKIYEKD